MNGAKALLKPETVPGVGNWTDPVLSVAIDEIHRENTARASIGIFLGRIAREGRATGVHLVISTMNLSAKMLDEMPGISPGHGADPSRASNARLDGSTVAYSTDWMGTQ